jgi:hypothetical protein
VSRNSSFLQYQEDIVSSRGLRQHKSYQKHSTLPQTILGLRIAPYIIEISVFRWKIGKLKSYQTALQACRSSTTGAEAANAAKVAKVANTRPAMLIPSQNVLIAAYGWQSGEQSC